MAVTGSRVPRSVVVATVLCAVVAAGALTASALQRRTDRIPASTPTSAPETSATPGCRVAPCQVLATATVGGTTVELVADAGGRSGRLRIGGPAASQVIETTVTGPPGQLSAASLQCYAASVSACLVRADTESGSTGTVVVGRSDKWSALERAFGSDIGYISLDQVTGDPAPEVITGQRDCAQDCDRVPVYAKVFGIGGQELGCTKTYSKLDQLPSYPRVDLTLAALRPCG